MWELLELIKAENPEAYKKLAERGVMIGFPVSIKNRPHRDDIGIPYHSTIKFFNPDADSTDKIHEIASKLDLVPPDPKSTRIEPGQFKDRFGNDVFVIKLHGPHADQIKAHNKLFSHMGYPTNFEHQPHISVDKKTWDEIASSGAKTAHEAGITFGHAELRQGHRVVSSYKPKIAQRFGGELTKSIVQETVLMDSELKSKYSKVLFLDGEYLSNYLQDNPSLQNQVIKKHEKRLEHHFGNNRDLINLAWEKGLKEAYKSRK